MVLARPARCDPAPVSVWAHGGKLYEVVSTYSLSDNAWQYELSGMTGAPRTGPLIVVVIPDATPRDGPFTPVEANHAVVAVADGVTPWPILLRLLRLAEQSGDIVGGKWTRVSAAETLLSSAVWSHGGRRFGVNSFHFAERGAWCYELYELPSVAGRNDRVEVQIPDVQPNGGQFVPGPAAHATFTAHGGCDFPWPVFHRFIAAIEVSGDIVEGDPAAGPAIDR